MALFWAGLAMSLGVATAQQPNNSTDGRCPIEVPGYFHHGSCDLLCRPATWIDILVFYLGNYFAHAGTVITLPGQSVASSLASIIVALLFPGGGILRALRIIFSRPILARTPLQTAARADALYAVVRRIGEQEPEPAIQSNRGDTQADRRSEEVQMQQRFPTRNPPRDGSDEILEVGDVAVTVDTVATTSPAQAGVTPAHFDAPLQPRPEPMSICSTKIHGKCRLPEGFDLFIVPEDATFENDSVIDDELPWFRRLLKTGSTLFATESRPQTQLCCSYNAIKVVISMAQLAFATTTLYKTRGDQLDKYGYAAFGLTAVPYAWMTLLNLFGNILCPKYDTVFVVESSGYDELQARLKRGTEEERASFTVVGTVGRLTLSADENLRDSYRRIARTGEVRPWLTSHPGGSKGPGSLISLKLLVFWVVQYAPLIIVGGLSRFQTNQSAVYQRVWTMMWLVCGLAFIAFIDLIGKLEKRPILNRRNSGSWPSLLRDVSDVVIAAAPAIGGYVVVGQMIKEFGVCSELRAGGLELQG